MILPSKRDYEKITKIIDRKKEQLKNSEKFLYYFFSLRQHFLVGFFIR